MRPYIGSIKLKELTRFHINKMYQEMVGKQDEPDGLSNTSIHAVHAWLRRALSVAVNNQILTNNPAINASAPRPNKKKFETLNESEIQTLLSLDDKWTPLFTALVGTGLRIGEALGLRWADIDLDKGELRVRRTLSGYYRRACTTYNEQAISLLEVAPDYLTTVALA